MKGKVGSRGWVYAVGKVVGLEEENWLRESWGCAKKGGMLLGVGGGEDEMRLRVR